MLISEKRRYDQAETVAEFFKDRVDVECQHMSRYKTGAPDGSLTRSTEIEFDLSATDPKFFIYEIARQAYEQGVVEGKRLQVNEVRKALMMDEIAKEY